MVFLRCLQAGFRRDCSWSLRVSEHAKIRPMGIAHIMPIDLRYRTKRSSWSCALFLVGFNDHAGDVRRESGRANE